MPEPLHPAVVHLPMALGLLMPLFVGAALYARRKKLIEPRVWVAVVVLQALLAGTALFAARTGEDEEERIAAVVAQEPIDAHRDSGVLLLRLATLTLIVAATGLLDGRTGSVARWLTLALALVVLVVTVRTGHQGGELVYRHGGAGVYQSK